MISTKPGRAHQTVALLPDPRVLRHQTRDRRALRIRAIKFHQLRRYVHEHQESVQTSAGRLWQEVKRYSIMFIAFQAVLETYAFPSSTKEPNALRRPSPTLAIPNKSNERNQGFSSHSEVGEFQQTLQQHWVCCHVWNRLDALWTRPIREKIEGSSSEDAFQSCIAKTLNTLVRSVTLKTGVSTEVLRL